MGDTKDFCDKLDNLAANGCIDECHKNLTIMVYNHLKDECEWTELKLNYLDSLKQIYLSGNDGISNLTIVPLDSERKQTVAALHDLFNHCHRIVLAVCSSDGTVVCCDLGDGLNDVSR